MSLIKSIESGRDREDREPPELIRSIVKLGFSGVDVEEFEKFAGRVTGTGTGITFHSLDIDNVETLKDVATESVFLFYVNNEKVDHVRGWNEDEMYRLTKLYFFDQPGHDGHDRTIIESDDIEPFECNHNNCFCGVDMSKLDLRMK